MSNLVPTHFVQQFNANVLMATQQRTSLLAPHVSTRDLNGTRGSVDFLGKSGAPRRRTERHGDTKLQNTPHNRRWYTASPYDLADMVDDDDKLKMLYDPTNPYAVNFGYSFGRLKDDVIIAAAFADVPTGVDGTSTTTWASQTAQILPESGSDGLTLAKLITARETLLLADVDPDDTWMFAASPRQMTNLLNTTEVKSADYNTVKALVQGDIDTFMGFKFLVTNRLLKSGNNRRCMIWHPTGIALIVPKEMQTIISKRADKNNATQIWCSMTLGAVRLREEMVIEVQCYDTTSVVSD